MRPCKTPDCPNICKLKQWQDLLSMSKPWRSRPVHCIVCIHKISFPRNVHLMHVLVNAIFFKTPFLHVCALLDVRKHSSNYVYECTLNMHYCTKLWHALTQARAPFSMYISYRQTDRQNILLKCHIPIHIYHTLRCTINVIFIYTNGQKKGYTVYTLNYSLVNLKHSIFLT